MTLAAQMRAGVEDLLSPLPDRICLVDATHLSPFFSGFLELRFQAEGIQFRWYGEQVWSEVAPWAELAFKAGLRNEQYRDDLRFSRDDAYQDGFAAGLEEARRLAAGQPKPVVNIGRKRAS